MANQKEYKIIINGIKESIDGIGTLQDSLDKLGKKVEESGGHFQTASKGMDELAKTNQKIAEYNEEYATALAANKAVLADHNKEVKAKIDLEKAEITVQEGLTDTYAHKQQLLTALGKVIKNTTGDTSTLKEQYATLNQELKDFDAELGNHQRNVGDYGQATKNLKQELREMQEEMADMIAKGIDKADPKFVALAQKAGQLKDAMGDARQEVDRFASDTKKLDDVINIAQSATAAFTLYKGAMSAFGIETEGAVEAIQKLQGAMAVLQSLKQLQESLEQNSATAKIFSKAMAMMGLSMDGATKASKLLRIGLASIGIGLIIGLVMTLIEYWDDIKKSFTDTFPILKTLSDKFNGLTGIIRGVGQAIVHWLTNPIITFAKVIKKVFSGDFKGAIEEAKNGIINQFTGLKTAFFKGVEDSRKKVETEAEKTKNSVIKTAKETVDTTKKYLDDWVKAEREGLEAAQALRDKINEKQKKDAESVAKAKDKLSKSEYERELAIIEAEKEQTKDKKKLNELEEKRLKLVKERAALEAKNSAASELDIDPSEIDSILDLTTGKYKDLTEQQKLVIDNLKTQLETLDIGLATALSKLFGGDGNSGGSSDKQNAFSKWFGDDLTQAFIELGQMTFDAVADTLSMTMDWVIEEAQDKLDEVSELHDEAVEKVAESQDRISELNDKMRESSGAQLEQYKQQMVDEMLLLQQREQEEKRLQKEKEKREKELEKKQHEQRKQDMQVQLLESISATALGVMKAFAQFGPIMGAIMGGIISTIGAVQQAIIMKQISKMADGGVLGGREHKDGGNPIPAMGVEVEKGEAVINKRSTAKYLPLLDAINAEGNGGKHTLLQSSGNVIGRYADGGVLNYQRIDDNFNQLNGTAAIANAIGSIDFHPVVSVQEISRVQRNVVEVRELSGARN